jgi:hypothetical protein
MDKQSISSDRRIDDIRSSKFGLLKACPFDPTSFVCGLNGIYQQRMQLIKMLWHAASNTLIHKIDGRPGSTKPP